MLKYHDQMTYVLCICIFFDKTIYFLANFLLFFRLFESLKKNVCSLYNLFVNYFILCNFFFWINSLSATFFLLHSSYTLKPKSTYLSNSMLLIYIILMYAIFIFNTSWWKPYFVSIIIFFHLRLLK